MYLPTTPPNPGFDPENSKFTIEIGVAEAFVLYNLIEDAICIDPAPDKELIELLEGLHEKVGAPLDQMFDGLGGGPND